jgi:hypothetical protein
LLTLAFSASIAAFASTPDLPASLAHCASSGAIALRQASVCSGVSL